MLPYMPDAVQKLFYWFYPLRVFLDKTYEVVLEIATFKW